MNHYRWIAVVAAVLLAAGVGVMAYNAGVVHGVAQSGKIVTGPQGVYPYMGWHPWGFGFFFGPLFLILFFFFFVVRGLFWGAWHRGRCGYRGLDEWHRQAHETMQK